MTNDDTTATSNELGGLLEAMATEQPPMHTEPDPLPTPGSPFDAALAVYHAAANGDDAANNAELGELHQQRQDQYRTAINDAIGGDAR